MGVTEENYKIITCLIKNYKGRLVIDADGLNTLAKYGKEVLKEKACEIILTPHIAEFGRLIAKDKEEVIKDPVTAAKAFAAEYGVVLVLKSAVTVITDGKEVYINTTGNAGLAKGGSGDVLTGLTAGLNAIACKEEPLFIAAAACYIFGKSGDIAVNESDEYSVVASDVIACIPKAIKAIAK